MDYNATFEKHLNLNVRGLPVSATLGINELSNRLLAEANLISKSVMAPPARTSEINRGRPPRIYFTLSRPFRPRSCGNVADGPANVC